jgi:cytidylate kinase
MKPEETPTHAQMIAIDGPAASGKSTVAERLAAWLSYLYFDTGVMYRAVTYCALERLGSTADEGLVTQLAETITIDVQESSIQDGRTCDVSIDGQDVTWAIRSTQVEANVSQVSAYPGVRRALSLQQRRIGLRGKVVMVGRDIGTVVLPEAEIKIYLDASVEVRARRRYTEVIQRGGSASFDDILAAMKRRDQIDSTRAVAPLRAADDAIQINTDQMGIEEVVDRIKSLIDK